MTTRQVREIMWSTLTSPLGTTKPMSAAGLATTLKVTEDGIASFYETSHYADSKHLYDCGDVKDFVKNARK